MGSVSNHAFLSFFLNLWWIHALPKFHLCIMQYTVDHLLIIHSTAVVPIMAICWIMSYPALCHNFSCTAEDRQ